MTNPQQHPRIDANRHDQIAPAVTAALLALGKAVDDSGLDKELTELIKLRASQINGCSKLVLDTPLSNSLGQRFYFRNGLLATSLRFNMTITQ